MVLRDEKERERLARLSKAIREKTTCRIYRNKLQSRKGEREINDLDVYLGLSACNREEACGICSNWECLDRFEEHLTHDEQVEFKHCLISSDARTFKKYQIEVSKMIREREDALQRNIEKEIAEKKRQKEIEEQAKIEAQVQRVMSERIDDFTKGELLEIMNGTEEGQRLVAERKARLDEEMRSAVQMGKNAINVEDGGGNVSTRFDETESKQKLETQKVPYIGSGKLHVFIHSFANIKEAEFMDGLFVRLTIVDGNGKPKESVKCFPNKLNGSGVNRGMLVFGTGTTLTTVLDTLEPGAFIVIELLHYKKKQSLKCWSYMDIQPLLTSTSDTLSLCLLQKPVDLKNIMRELIKLKHSEDGKFITSIKPYGNKANLDLMVSFKIV